jgi:D-beta-D-heptose 7-phosphate kinase/D-beta-D-heptose 1-phosphate adenosyltransferase
MKIYKNLISKFKGKKILVIGDVILDQHIQGSISRISPEAPVPIVLQSGEPSFAPGGAANVANNLRNLNANVLLVGRIGKDVEGKVFLKELKKRKISTNGIFQEKTTPTVVKTRIVAQNQQVLRLDREKLNGLHESPFLKNILNLVQKQISSLDAIIISDYGKGMITRPLITEVCSMAQKKKVVVVVDPKVEHFAYYRGVTGITPNKNEAENAIRNIKITQVGPKRLDIHTDKLATNADVERAGQGLLKFLNLESILITLGEHGMCLCEKNQPPRFIHTRAREVYDVTGAGDTVISVFTLALTAGATKFQAADLANFAAGIVVGKRGAVPVSPRELLEATKEHV